MSVNEYNEYAKRNKPNLILKGPSKQPRLSGTQGARWGLGVERMLSCRLGSARQSSSVFVVHILLLSSKHMALFQFEALWTQVSRVK